jgi:putative MATE family efflux protein
MDSHQLFSNTSPGRLFRMAAIPGSISMLAAALFQIIDGVLVGNILGTTAFAAINLAMPIVFINFALADLVGVGSSVPISIQLGRKNDQGANNIFTCSCIMIVATGFLIGAAIYAAAPLIADLIGISGDLATLTVQYMRIYALFSPFTTIVFAMDNYLRICGKIKASLGLNILMSLISVVLEVLFLAVFKFGIWGAALATCISMTTCAIIALVPFFKRSLQLKFVKPVFHQELFKQILANGSPNFLNTVAGRITAMFINMLLVQMGGARAVSVYGVLMYVDGFVQPLMYGLTDSLQPAIGYNWGARQFSRVRALAKYCFGFSTLVSLVSMAVVFLLADPIARLFLHSGDTSLVTLTVFALQLFSLTYLTRGVSMASLSFILAIEKPLPATIISVCTAVVFPLGVVFSLSQLELTGLWLNLPITSFLAALLSAGILFSLRHQIYRKDGKRPIL